MEIRLSPEQEARLTVLAASARRSTGELVQEAITLWEERENARALAEFRASLDRAEASLSDGGGRIITRASMRDLAEDVKRRGRERRAPARSTLR
ncbi:MAG: hypothetical protein ACREFH_03495 [Stellaceae bacterium]